LKEAKEQYVESRIVQARDSTEELEERVAELERVLDHTLSIDDSLDFESLKVQRELCPFKPDLSIAYPSTPPSKKSFLASIPPPSFLGKIVPTLRRRHEAALKKANEQYAAACESHSRQEAERKRVLEKARQGQDRIRAARDAGVAAKNQEIEDFKKSYQSGDAKAIVGYCSMVLERSEYPEGFPQKFRAAYVPESKQLVVDYELPPPTLVPEVLEYRYLKARDAIDEKPRKPAEIRSLYQDIVAAVALRTCHELFESDQAGHLDVVAL
jgi:restriction system protein